jgi:hypothetical protein
MEKCQNDLCICRNYDPEYDKKFTTGSKKLTKSFSTVGGGSMGNSHSTLQGDAKKLPFKLNFKTKYQVFTAEFSNSIDNFLEEQ